MMKIATLVGMVLFLACGQREPHQDRYAVRKFTAAEDSAMLAASIDGGVTAVLRAKIPEAFHLHTPAADEINARSGFPTVHHRHRGVAFKVLPSLTMDRINAIARRIAPEGYRPYRSRMGFGDELDEVCVLLAPDQFDILHYEQTDAINFGITTDSLIDVLRAWDRELGLNIVGASHDWVDATVTKEPKDWLALAERVYAFCPDVVDQGAGSIKALADEMKQNQTLYLWWD